MSDAVAPRGRAPRGRKRGIALLLAAALVVAGSVAASQTTSSRELDPPAPETVAGAVAGTAYCPVTAAEGEGATLVLASTGDQDAEVVISRFADGTATAAAPQLLPAGTSVALPVPAEQLGQPVTVDWRGGPVVALYQLSDGQEVLGAPCAAHPGRAWHLVGFDTSLGSTSLLHLFNPFGQDAVVSLQFGTVEGPVELVIADEILVPAGTSAVLNLAQFRPETPDLAVTVSSRAGRIIPQGQVSLAPPADNVQGVTGRALLQATAEPSETVILPRLTVDAVTSSWVTVYNPAERPAAVQVQVSTPLGDATALASERTIPAGGTARIELEGLSALPDFGVQVMSVNGVGVVATGTSAISDVQRSGVAMSVGASAADERWTVAGGQPPDSTVTLYNPGGEPATASVDVAGQRPETWTAVTVPPNGTASLSLAQAQPEGPAIVSADLPLVAGLVNLRPESATAYWAATGTTTDELVGGGAALPVQRDPQLTSVPAVSATVTPTPTAVDDSGDAEGGLGEEVAPTGTETPSPTADPTIVPPVSPTPTVPQPTTGGQDEPAPTPTGSGTAPPPGDPSSPGPSPLPPGTTEEEGNLFGKVRTGSRRHLRR